ncbi:MAG: Gfo/Idh/MocA family oxidoreductase [Bryobacteraceae bacterium]|nr:Gfo/Idh/MocA family oxidoreductase [Bryobacteraceae bacterium]
MPFSWGILGAGDIARKHVAAAMQNAPGHRLAAIMRRNPAEAVAFAKDFNVDRVYTSAEDLVADPTIDAVFIGTPPSSHAELTALAARAGKHVLCEKPIASTVAAAQAMIDVCEGNNVRLMICHYQRANTRHQQIRQWLNDAVIGRVVSVRLNFSSYSPPTPDAWRHSRAVAGGGPIMDLGSHCLDLLMYLCGPIDTAAVLTDSLAYHTDVEDTATMLLRLKSGAHATVTTHWSAHCPDPEQSNAIEIWGTAGMILSSPLFSKDSSGKLLLHRATGCEDHSRPAGKRIHEDVIEQFRIAVATGGPMLVPAEDALAGLEVILAR